MISVLLEQEWISPALSPMIKMKVIKQKIPSFIFPLNNSYHLAPSLDNCLFCLIIFYSAPVYISYSNLFCSQVLLLLPLLLTTGCSAQSGDLLKELLNDGSLSVVGLYYVSSWPLFCQ